MKWIVWATPERGDWYVFGTAINLEELRIVKNQALSDQDRAIAIRLPGNPPWETKITSCMPGCRADMGSGIHKEGCIT